MNLCKSNRGQFHMLHNVANQDSFAFLETDGWVIAAVADGVSLTSMRTFSHAEIASHVCVQAVITSLKSSLRSRGEDEDVLNLIHEAFLDAYDALKVQLKRVYLNWNDCQTTLLVAVYKERRLWTGMAGDGGLLYLNSEEEVGLMMTRLKTSSSVFPISSREHWRFFESDPKEEDVKAFLLATDGVFDSLVCAGLEGLEVDFPLISKLFSLNAHSESSKTQEQMLEDLLLEMDGRDDQTIVMFWDDDQ